MTVNPTPSALDLSFASTLRATGAHLTGAHLTGKGLSRRRLLSGILAVPAAAAAAALLAACGDDTVRPASSDTPGTPPGTDGSATIAHPTDASVAVIRITSEGGFVPVEYAFVNTPALVVSGDGRAFTPGAVPAIFPGPLLMPMGERSISEAGIQRLLSLATSHALLAPPPDYSVEMTIADAPSTVVRIVTSDGTWEHRAYALGMSGDGQGEPAETTPARQALLDFVRAASDLATTVGASELGPEEIDQPDEFRLQAAVVDEGQADGMDPAPTIVDWPATTGLDLAAATECIRIGADAAGQVFDEATQLTWFRQGDAVYRIAVAGVLPGDPAC